MGTYVLSICLFNFIAGFAAAMYMHNPRLFALRRGTKRVAMDAAGSAGGFSAIEISRGGENVDWVLPDAWREALLHVKLSVDATPETVLHGLLYWQNITRKRMLDFERRLRVAEEAERVDESLLALLENILVSNREFLQRLREASKLLQSLDFDHLEDLDDRIHDYIFDLEPCCSEVSEEDLMRELKTLGIRGQTNSLRRVIDSGNPFRDFIELLIAERLRERGEIANVAENCLRESEDDVPNRIGFVQSLEKHFESETEPFQICSFHLDRFRQINERIGVADCDELLRSFGVLLRHLLPGGDGEHRLARMFGATIVAFLPKTDRNGAEVLAERIRQAVEASSIELSSGPIECTISCAIIEAVEKQDPKQIFDRFSPIITLLNKSGGNRTGAEVDGEPVIIEPRAFQVESRVVRGLTVETVA